MKQNRPFPAIFPKVASEGYCCLYGYIGLCRARGETKAQMASWLKVGFWTMKYHFRLFNSGRHQCQGYSDCLKPIILDLRPDFRRDTVFQASALSEPLPKPPDL
jgi:hypothetical protein